MKRLRALVATGIEYVRVHPRASAAIAVVLAAILFGVFGGAGNKDEAATVTVAPKEFLQQVSVSGKVVAADDVALAFEETGRVTSVLVKEGDRVAVGQALVYLDSGTLIADLRAAEAEVAVKRVELDNRGVNLEEVRKEQDTLVASARRTLFSEGLAAVPASDTYDMTAPVVSGAYKSEEEGTYKVVVKHRAVASNDMELRVYDLERLDATAVPDSEPAPLGTYGLFLSFPDTPEVYDGTTWYVSVPNVKSSSYLSNYNAYQEALRARDKAIADAEAELSERSVGMTIARAELAKAEADVERIRAELGKRSLRAPFSGIITAVSVDTGEAVSAGTSAVSLISADELELESFVPEINISFLSVGDSAAVTLDAYGEDVVFPAKVAAIDPAETVRDGVSTYRVVLHFDAKDDRVRSGMTANIVITTDARSGILSVPQGAVAKEKGKPYVTVRAGKKDEKRAVSVGLVSSLGEVEILSGLREGDIVVLPR